MGRSRRPMAPFARHHARGVAALEFAVVLPVLILLFFGTVNLLHFQAAHRKLDAVAELVGDIVARENLATSTAKNTDNIRAAELMYAPRKMNDVGLRVLIFDYRQSGSNRLTRWSRDSAITGVPAVPGGSPVPGPATPCAPPNPWDPRYASSFATGRDVVIVAVCATYAPPAAGVITFLDGLTTLRSEYGITTYQSPTLSCTNPC